MSIEGRGSEDMFLRILMHRESRRGRKRRATCPDCGRTVAVFKSGKFYKHTCEVTT